MKDKEKAIDYLKKLIDMVERGDVVDVSVSYERSMNKVSYDDMTMQYLPTREVKLQIVYIEEGCIID